MVEKLMRAKATIRNNWDKPRPNECVTYKEICAFSVGGMGVKVSGSLMSYLALLPTCLLFATVYGLSPRHFVILTVITNVISIIKTPFVSMLVDKTHTKIGKFRPYLLWAGIPTVISISVLAWIPLDASPTVKVVLVGIFVNLMNIAQPLYNNAYMGISQIITPNSAERTKIMSLSEFLANLGPSIIQFVLPTLAGICFGKDGMKDVRTYRIFLPIFAVLGFLLGLMVMINTKERVILVRKLEQNIKFSKGLSQIARNRYFWIVSISKFFDGFKGGIGALLVWVCTYQLGYSSILGVVQTIVSVAFTPGILLAPLMMKKMGARAAGFISHILNCFASLLMLFTFRQGFIFFVIALFCYNFAMGPQYVIQTSILSDGLDYNQDKYGMRVEGIAQNFMQVIATIGTIVSTAVFSFIYETCGLVADPVTGLTDYDILVNPEIREPIIQWVIIVVIVMSALSAIPYLFCNLKQRDIRAIRERLEYKKFIGDNNLENATEEEKKKAYEEYLENIRIQHEQAKYELEMKKKETEEEYRAKKNKKREFEQSLDCIREQYRSEGKSEKEIDILIKEEKNRHYIQEKAIREEERRLAKAERLNFKQRKKEFIKADVERRKREGEKHYLRILAKESFEDMIVEESNAAAAQENEVTV